MVSAKTMLHGESEHVADPSNVENELWMMKHARITSKNNIV